MQRILLIYLLIIISFPVLAQTDESILGMWYVEKVIVTESLPQGQNEKLKGLISALSKTTFKFEEGGKFTFATPIKEMQMPAGKWSYDSTKKKIKITEVKDPKSNLMLILIEKGSNGEIYFLLDETPLKLKMKKQNI